MNTKNLIAGLAFLAGAAIGIYSLFTKEFRAYYVCGTVIFLMAGISFLKRVRD